MAAVDDYYIGMICPDDSAFTAAEASLDESHHEPDLLSLGNWVRARVHPNDTNLYTSGKIGKHKVVIACGLSSGWPQSAIAITATHMIRSFPNIKAYLLITTAEGAPSVHHDIRLGDIVVGESHYGDAVFQFDYETRMEDLEALKDLEGLEGLEDLDDIPCRPQKIIPVFLELAVKGLKERYRSNGNRLEDSINSVIDKNPMLQRYRRPDDGSDILYANDDSSEIMMRPERTDHKNSPVIHYGKVASGSQDIRDAAFWDELSRKKNVLCFEKGAAGVVYDFPFLVICGISDCPDMHYPERWRDYAALAAAFYAKDLIHDIPVEDGKNIDGTLSHKTMAMKGMSKIPPPAKKVVRVEEPEESPRREDYTVGVICAIEFEMSAVRYMLDKVYKRLERQKGDSTMYVLGELSGHNVVLACLPGTQGKGAAALVVKDMARTFPSIELRLMVGIGGGVPSPKNDIRLGDVVVSMPDGYHGGVVQYDLVKSTEDGFFLKGFLSPPPDILRSAVGLMRGEHRGAPKKIPEFLSAMFEKDSRLQKSYQSPAPELDVLFKLDGKTKVADRPAREPGPEIHYGLVASGDQVIRSAANATEISKRVGGNDILCFEMEAAGIMTQYPCIVIRGISDYADSHKNDAWQHYAAATAAACAKELLSYCH